MSRRKSEITGHMNERDFRTLSSWSCRQEASAARALSLNRSTVNAASQFAEAAGGTRRSNSTSASAFQMAPPLTPLHAWAPGIIGKRRGDVASADNAWASWGHSSFRPKSRRPFRGMGSASSIPPGR
jgi:hypothetical protein